MPTSPTAQMQDSRLKEPKEEVAKDKPRSPKLYGQVITYIEDRLYLASYTHPPDADTPFPFPQSSSQGASRHRHSKSQPVASSPKKGLERDAQPPLYFSIDYYLLYNRFHADFGPLHVGHLYRFACWLHEALSATDSQKQPLVLWSHADSRCRANAACLLACYMVLIQSWPPHLALAPLAQMDPPPMPFRDAGYSQADFILNIQDVVYGVWRAQQEKLILYEEFNLEEYEQFERVDQGDFNWICSDFVAFASPQHKPVATLPVSSPEFAALPRTPAEVMKSELPQPFKNVLCHFKEREVGLVVRLNSELYCSSYFTALGMRHLDMIFEDGTCPTLAMVRKFIVLAHDMITVKHKSIAVHCKAGLGRTGCLIGAYLIYRHGFTANEVIAFMRFMRPGMVVGPQQHWLHLNQNTFREWWFEDRLKAKMVALKQSTPPRNSASHRLSSNSQTHTPTHSGSKRRALGELDYNEKGLVSVNDEHLPAPTPGQPRKTNKLFGNGQDIYVGSENRSPAEKVNTEIISVQQRHTQGESESEEEYQLRMLARRPSGSPTSSAKRRAISCTTTTTTTTEWSIPGGVEKPKEALAKTPLAGKAMGNLAGAKRSDPLRKTSGGTAGIRKTSSRIGSVGALSNAARIKQ